MTQPIELKDATDAQIVGVWNVLQFRERMMSKTKFFKTEVQAQLILDGLEPFEPSRFCTQKEIDNGGGKPRILEFANGFAIQLGYCGNYYPDTKNNLYNSD